MAYESVLDREMFRPKSRGVEELREPEDNGDVKLRREQADAMIEAAKQKFDPANFQTLTEQERPQVFRPVAVNMPAQQQTATTAQRMQQMAAQGVRPVGMARGGSVAHFADGGFNTLSPTITSDQADRLAKERADAALFNLRTLGAGVEPTDLLTDEERENVRIARRGKAPYDPYQLEGGSPAGMTYNLADDPTTWTPDFREAMIGKILRDRTAERNKVDPRFQSYVEEPTPEKIAREIDQKAAEIRMSRGQTRAKEDAALRAEAAPDKRDFAGDRAETQRGIAALADMEKVVAAGRDTTEAPLISDLENQKGITALADMERSIASGRDAYGAEAPLAVDQEARGIVGQMGRAGELRSAAGIRSGEEKAAAPITAQAAASAPPAAAAAAPAAKGAGGLKAEGESSDLGPMTIESIRSQRAREREENVNLALIQAGLSMMAGRSSNALTNIGEGARAGIGQFASQESESKKAMRESMRDYMDQKRLAQQDKLARDEMALREKLAYAQIGSSEKLSEATLNLQGELGRGRLQLDRDVATKSWATSDAKLKLDEKIAENTRKYQQGQLDLGQLNAENDKAYKDATIEHQKRVQDFNEKQLPDSVRSAAAIGGWDPATKAPPTTKQILDGLSRMKEADEMDTLEKLVRDPLVEEDLKKTAQERLTAIINARASRSSSTGGSGFKYSGSTPKAP